MADRTLNLELLALGRLVPKGRRVLVLGKDGARLAEGLGAMASDVNPAQIEGGVSLAKLRSPPPEVAVLVGGIAKCEEYLSLIRALADNCIPVIYGSQSEQTDRESAVGRIIEERFEVIRFGWNVCFAFPRHLLAEPAWLQSHIKRLLKRHEQSELDTTTANHGGGKVFVKLWEQRDRIVAGWVPKGMSIADIGCGAMTAEKLLRPRAYLPIDLEHRDERTRVLDLNAAVIPASWLENVELVLFLGVLEYLDEPLRHLGQIASLSKRMLVSYSVFEKRSRLKQMTSGLWRSTLREEDLRRAFATYRYDVEAFIEMGRQSLYLIKPEDAPPLGDPANNVAQL